MEGEVSFAVFYAGVTVAHVVVLVFWAVAQVSCFHVADGQLPSGWGEHGVVFGVEWLVGDVVPFEQADDVSCSAHAQATIRNEVDHAVVVGSKVAEESHVGGCAGGVVCGW